MYKKKGCTLINFFVRIFRRANLERGRNLNRLSFLRNFAHIWVEKKKIREYTMEIPEANTMEMPGIKIELKSHQRKGSKLRYSIDSIFARGRKPTIWINAMQSVPVEKEKTILFPYHLECKNPLTTLRCKFLVKFKTI